MAQRAAWLDNSELRVVISLAGRGILHGLRNPVSVLLVQAG